MNIYITIAEQAKRLGVHVQTLRRWDRLELMKSHHRTEGNHRRYEVEETESQPEAETIGYVRVSTAGQKDDLVVQEKSLKEKATNDGIQIDTIVSDVGSGINCKRKGFIKIINQIMIGKVKHIVIMHKDRLVRFGYEIIERLCQIKGVKITVLEKSPFETAEQILCGNLIAVITVFCSALYGMRSHSNKSKIVKTVNDQLCAPILSTV